ncbi:MAG: membrane dipeptidase [Pseudomonadota bacterium]
MSTAIHRCLCALIAFPLALGAMPGHAQATLSEPDILSFHDQLLTLDSHIDIRKGYATSRIDPSVLNGEQVNLPSMRIGGLDAGFFIVYTRQGELSEEGYEQGVAMAEERYHGIVRMLRAYPDQIALAITADQVEAIHADGKLVALIGIENSFPLGMNAQQVRDNVALWAARGARYASITHFGHNQFGGSSNPMESLGDGEDPGLSELGKVLVQALNDHGVMVDISHVGEATAGEAIALSRAPVIASHSTVKAVHDNPRGLSDAQLRALRDTGGVAQITAFRAYLAELNPQLLSDVEQLRNRLGLLDSAAWATVSEATMTEYRSELARIRGTYGDVTLDQYLDHVDHAVRVAGIDHVGLSGDFDGGGGVAGWDGAADSPNVTAGLLERGYTQQDIAKLWGQNLLRVMRAVQAAGRQTQ